MPFAGDYPMKRVSKEKRTQLVIVALVTGAVLALIYFGLIQRQYFSLAKIADAKKTADAKLLSIKSTITNTAIIAKELAESSDTLEKTGTDMASGDLYSWTYDTLRRFKQSYQVDIPEVGQPAIGKVDLLPEFPYKQIRFSVSGAGYYHDLGKFIADFENHFPHARLINLTVEPLGGQESSEKLSFKMEVVALVKSNPS
jgi:Tfp pilus assembly protein PilO